MPDQLVFEFSAPAPHLRQLWTPEDIFRSADQQTVELFREDRRVERKGARIQPNDLGDYLSMYANTQPYGGIIFIGVEKDGRISGCKSLETERLNRIETVRRYCPDARHEFKRVAVLNSNGEQDFVIAIRVHYNMDKLVETVAGDAYIRERDEKRLLSETEKREIRITKGEIDYELERTILKYPDDFDMTLVRTFADQYINKRKLKERYAIEDILNLAKLEGSNYRL